MQVKVMSNETPLRRLFSMGCSSGDPVLIPPDTDVRVHITSSGFHEWDANAGSGKLIRLHSSGHVDREMRLVPE